MKSSDACSVVRMMNRAEEKIEPRNRTTSPTEKLSGSLAALSSDLGNSSVNVGLCGLISRLSRTVRMAILITCYLQNPAVRTVRKDGEDMIQKRQRRQDYFNCDDDKCMACFNSWVALEWKKIVVRGTILDF